MLACPVVHSRSAGLSFAVSADQCLHVQARRLQRFGLRLSIAKAPASRRCGSRNFALANHRHQVKSSIAAKPADDIRPTVAISCLLLGNARPRKVLPARISRRIRRLTIWFQRRKVVVHSTPDKWRMFSIRRRLTEIVFLRKRGCEDHFFCGKKFGFDSKGVTPLLPGPGRRADLGEGRLAHPAPVQKERFAMVNDVCDVRADACLHASAHVVRLRGWRWLVFRAGFL